MASSHQPTILQALRKRLTALDQVTLSYIAAFGLGILLLGRDRPGWQLHALSHVFLIIAGALIVWRWEGCDSGVRGFLRHFYPAILYTVFYSETEVAMHWVSPVFFDAQLVALEKWLFGVDFNLWIIPVQKAPLNEWMMLGYFSYYLLIPIVGISLFLRGRVREVNAFLTATTITFVISYVGFVLYPVEGPRYFLGEYLGSPLKGYVFVPLTQWIIKNGAVHGGCMPSSHVAIAWVTLIWAYRTQRRLAYVLTPLVATLAVATVWGRFHYVADVVVGLGVGVMGLWISDKLLVRRVREESISMEDSRLRPVSPMKSLGGTG